VSDGGVSSRLDRHPEIIAHRGAHRGLIENTLPAFVRAVEQGADAIELDVHATRNGIVVVNHDPVPRGTPEDPALADIPIAQLTLKELRRISLAPNTGVPTLAQVLRTVRAPIKMYIEIKGRGIEAAVVETIRAAPDPERCAVHGFDHRVVPRVRSMAPEIPGGILSTSYLIDPAQALRAADARDYWIWWEHVDQALCDAVHGAGGRVIAWTVNDPAAAAHLAAIGVDGLCTDDVPAVRRALGRTALVESSGGGIPRP
jgi:glycerophosphoryl diester phosphodiesterase